MTIRSAFTPLGGGKREKPWQMPKMLSDNDNGIILTNSNMRNPWKAFDYNIDNPTDTNESWGGWINIALPYEVILTHGVFITGTATSMVPVSANGYRSLPIHPKRSL